MKIKENVSGGGGKVGSCRKGETMIMTESEGRKNAVASMVLARGVEGVMRRGRKP